jgi:glucose/mannose transport system substrate-binding protein
VKARTRTALGTIASIVCAASLFPITGCSSAQAPQNEGSHVVEIFSWWTAGGEKNALDALIGYFTKSHPQDEVINAAQEGADNAQQLLDMRIANGNYPDTFQLNAGRGLREFVARTASDGTTKLLSPLDVLPEAGALKTALPQAVLDAVSVDGQLYAVPVNVHRNNTLFYNKKIFDQNQLTPPTTVAELLQIADTISKLPTKVIPLAVGSHDPWTVTLLVFENLLVARKGGQYFHDYFTGKLTADDQGMVDTLNDAVALWKYTDPSGRMLLWDEAVAQVEGGQAAMTIMGDWAKGHFESVGQQLGVDFGQVPMPGAQNSFVYNPDCFPLMTGAPNRPVTIDLLSTFASIGAEDVFNPLKGSIPARNDADKSLYDAASQQAIADFQTKELVLALSGLLATDVGNALDTAFGTFADSQNPEDVLSVLRTNYTKFTP